MKTKTILSILFLTFIYACGTPNVSTKGEFETFKEYTDSLLEANNKYLNGTDTTYVESPSAEDPSLVVLDTVIVAHSNLFDTSQYNYTINIKPTIEKYNAMEQNLDSLKAKMDAKTIALFESIKQKMNEIKQPIK
jgi:hypothetical protein